MAKTTILPLKKKLPKEQELEQTASTKAPNDPFKPNTPFKPFIPTQKTPQQPEAPPQKQVPMPEFFPSEEGAGGAKLIKGSGGSVFLETLKGKEAGQQGLAGQQGGLSGQQQAIETQNILAERQRQIIQQGQLAQLGVLTPEQQALNPFQNEGLIGVGATAAGGIGGAIGGAGAGAALGSVIPGIGTTIGGIAGGIIGGTGGTLTKISLSQKQDVKQAFKTFKGAKGNFAWIINKVNSGEITSVNQAVQMWDEELANFLAAERGMKELTSNDLNRFLSGGTDEMREIEAYKRRLPELQQELITALMNPNPNKIIPNEFNAENE